MKKATLALLCAAVLAGCSSQAPSGDVATVDVARLTSNWPKFLNYQNQMNADVATIQRSSASPREKQQQVAALNQQYEKFNAEITGDVRNAVNQIAADKHYKLVLTREFTAYGGTDITPDVEKALQITESSPSH